jgi:hypothetical protein
VSSFLDTLNMPVTWIDLLVLMAVFNLVRMIRGLIQERLDEEESEKGAEP